MIERERKGKGTGTLSLEFISDRDDVPVPLSPAGWSGRVRYKNKYIKIIQEKLYGKQSILGILDK